MLKEIKYNGYTANPSDYECPDGDLAVATNVIQEDGSLRHMPEPLEWGRTSIGNQLVFIHKTGRTAQYITSDGSTLYWSSALDAANPTEIHTFTDETIKKVIAVGNTLVISTSATIHYALWKYDSYTYLGTEIPQPKIGFALKVNTDYAAIDEIAHIPGRNAYDAYNYITAAGTNQVSSFSGGEAMANSVFSYLNPALTAFLNDNKFVFPFFVRYALRLYDESYVYPSPPVLIIPQTDIVPYVDRSAGSPVILDGGDTYVHYFIELYKGVLQYKILNDQSISNWKDIVKSVDFFVSKPIYTYDQGGSNMPCFVRSHTDGSTIDISYLNDWLGHTFMRSGNVGVGSPSVLHFYADYISFNSHTSPHIPLPKISNDTLLERINSVSQNFYKISSVKIEYLPTNIAFNDVEIKSNTLKNLTQQTQLDDELYTTYQKDYSGCLAYNNRLIKYGITRTSIFDKKSSGMFFQTFNYNEGSGVAIEDDYIEISVRYENDTKFQSSLAYLYTSAQYPLPYIFIPDTTVKEIFIRKKTSGTYTKRRLQTTLHPYLNGVYVYLGFDPFGGSDTEPTFYGEGDKHVVYEPFKLYNSDVDNPFRFPASGVVSVGTGVIKAVATAAKALSQGQFGQFPLYAFTDEGVWAMEIASTGIISARQPITHDVVLGDGDSVTQIDNAVLFASERGIMLLQGSDSICISTDIDTKDPFALIGLQGDSSSESVIAELAKVQNIEIAPFLEFLQECRMIYDYTHQRIIVFNPSTVSSALKYPYAYIYSLKDKKWGLAESNIVASVNDYPRAMAITTQNNVIVDFCKEPDGTTTTIEQQRNHALIVTRPLKLDQPDVLKTIDTIIQRGKFPREATELIPIDTEAAPTFSDIYDESVIDGIDIEESEIGEADEYEVIFDDKNKRFIMSYNTSQQDYYYYAHWVGQDEYVAPDGHPIPDIYYKDNSGNVYQYIDGELQEVDPYEPVSVHTVRSILYGSRDLIHWHLVASSKDHILRGFHGTPYKYFRIVLLTYLAPEENIWGCTVQYTPRMTNHPR